MPDLPTLPPDQLEQTAPGRILVVDDEPDIRESLEVLLSSEGFDVTLAQNATEGLKRLDSSSYDLVLLDLMMPDKSGMQVLEEVRARDTETPSAAREISASGPAATSTGIPFPRPTGSNRAAGG